MVNAPSTLGVVPSNLVPANSRSFPLGIPILSQPSESACAENSSIESTQIHQSTGLASPNLAMT